MTAVKQNGEREQKMAQIFDCLNQPEVNLWLLREFALTRGGLVNADMRRKAWRKLVGLNNRSATTSDSPCCVKQHDVCPEKASTGGVATQDLDLIRQDVRRSVLFRFPNTNANSRPQPTTPSGESSSQHDPQQTCLASVLETTISQPLSPKQEKLHYYQGLHDLAGVVMFNLDCNVQDTCAILRRLCQSHLRDCLREDFSQITWLLNTVLLPLIEVVDKDVHDFLVWSEVELSNTVLPWIITWFTHVIHDEQLTSRLLDAFMASHPLLPLYFSVAIMVHPTNRREILCSECDPAIAHMTICGLLSRICNDWTVEKEVPEKVIAAQELIDNAIDYMKLVPPRSLLSLANSYRYESSAEPSSGRAASMSLLKAPPSWALASVDRSCDARQITLLTSPEKARSTSKMGSLQQHVRARIASGVEFSQPHKLNKTVVKGGGVKETTTTGIFTFPIVIWPVLAVLMLRVTFGPVDGLFIYCYSTPH